MAHKMTLTDWASKRWEANQLFTPSTPISVADLFAGRSKQMLRIIDTVGERGRHVILYGERGVGKTSLSQIVPYLVPVDPKNVKFCRIQCFPGDTFASIAKKVFKEIRFTANIGNGETIYDVSQIYPGDVTPDDFVREVSNYNENYVPIIVIDEFNEISDSATSVLLANLIKALSDTATNVTLVIVGVGDNVKELIANHESIERCTEEILMPRMTKGELREIIEKRIGQLGMTIAGNAKWQIINLSKGLPQYVHALGKHSCFEAIKGRRLTITEADCDRAIDSFLAGSDQTFKSAYELATRSNQPDNLFKQVLTACSLAQADEDGYFVPASVCAPLSGVVGRIMKIANFQNHLKEFTEERRGAILQRIGEPRSYRFRFRHPAMQPYAIMRGIRENIVDDEARQALSFPEQPDLFSTSQKRLS